MDSFEQERLFLPGLKRFEDFLEGEVIACLVWPEILWDRTVRAKHDDQSLARSLCLGMP